MSWQPASTLAERLTPDRALLVGGSADLRSSLHVAPGPQHPALAESALRRIAALAAAEGRGLVFPYFSQAARDTLTAASADRIAWRVLAREAHFGNILDPRREDRLSSQVRGVLRRDRRLLAQADLTGQVTSWPDMAAEAAELIAAHNIRKGKPDHPEFVRMRYQQWDQCHSIRLVVFTAAAPGVSGLLTALVWRDDLELYEIGLTGSEGRTGRLSTCRCCFTSPSPSRGRRSCGTSAPAPPVRSPNRAGAVVGVAGQAGRPPGTDQPEPGCA